MEASPDLQNDQSTHLDKFFSDTVDGLKAKPKSLPCKYFYDKRGSELFDEICQLEEYYPTRTELSIMEEFAPEMASRIGSECQLIELGSGSSLKTRILLEHLHRLVSYVPVDISEKHLLDTSLTLAEQFPNIAIQPVVADFTADFAIPEPHLKTKRRIIYFPGSTIGNFDPDGVVELLHRLSILVGIGGGLLIGIDLKKDRETLEAAYDDSKGITAEFNRNILVRMKRELNAELDIDQFDHRAAFNTDEGRIEMHLVSKTRQTIKLDSHVFELEPGETIHTENSYKYDLDEFKNLAFLAGFQRIAAWTDDENLFSVQYFEVG